MHKITDFIQLTNHQDKDKNRDLNMYICGIEKCKPGHSWGPGIRDHYLIHYVINGKGKFIINKQEYLINAKQGFLIVPDTISFYQADNDEPWFYIWLGFNGLMAETYLKRSGLSINNPVFSYAGNELEEIIRKMISLKEINSTNQMLLTGYLYHFLAYISKVQEQDKAKHISKNKYIKLALDYITYNYSRQISIEKISEYIGLDRTYFFTIFKKEMGISPQKYLINFRLNQACKLMKNTELSIAEISRSVGYQDPLYFSKLFKKEKGLSPSKYRKLNMRSEIIVSK